MVCFRLAASAKQTCQLGRIVDSAVELTLDGIADRQVVDVDVAVGQDIAPGLVEALAETLRD